MFRFLIPVLILGIAVTGFFVFVTPMYKEVSVLKTEVAAYNEALDNSKALENERDKLTAKYNTIDPEDLSRLQKLLPDNIDNIRLILEIEKIASPYGMVLKNVKYNSDENVSSTPGEAVIRGGGIAPQETSNEYGTWNLEFSVTGSYNNFINFTNDLETNLRIVDVGGVSFTSSQAGALEKSNSAQVYTYNFKIKTYWLKK